MDTEVIMGLIGVGSATISSTITWLINRRGENANTDKTVIEGMQKSLEFYEHLSDDTTKRLEEAVKERNEMKVKIDKQDDKIEALRQELTSLSVSLCFDMSCELRKKIKVNNNGKLSESKE